MSGTKMRLLRYSGNSSGGDISELEQEIIKARQYRETDIPYDDLDARLDYIQSMLGQGGGGMDYSGNVLIYGNGFRYNLDNYGNIVSEMATGEVTYLINYVYDDSQRIEKEIIEVGGKNYAREYTYNEWGLSNINGHKLCLGTSRHYFNGVLPFVTEENCVFEIGSEGLPIRKDVDGDITYSVEYSYLNGVVAEERIIIDNYTYPRSHEQSNGLITKSSGYFMDIANVGCSPVIVLYRAVKSYEYNAMGLPVKKIVTGDVDYIKHYLYSMEGDLLRETIELKGNEYEIEYDQQKGYFIRQGQFEKETGGILGAILSTMGSDC